MSDSSSFAPNPALLVLVFLGLAIALCATLTIPWPSDVPGEPDPRLVPHWDRLAGTPPAPDFPAAAPDLGWWWRRIWDGLYYVILLGGIGSAAWAGLQPDRKPWIGLVGVGLLGLIYTAGIVRFNGPLVAAPGYLIVLISALFVLLSQRPAAPTA